MLKFINHFFCTVFVFIYAHFVSGCWSVNKEFNLNNISNNRNNNNNNNNKSHNTTQNIFSDWGTLKHGAPQGTNLGPLIFIIYTNDPPLRIHSVSEPVLYVDDTSIIISSRNFEDFCSVSNLVLSCMNKWFASNNHVLEVNKKNNKIHNKELITFNITYWL